MRARAAGLLALLALAGCGEDAPEPVARVCHAFAPIDADDPTSGMIRVPGGVLRMGAENQWPEEAPVRDVAVDTFWISETEITNAMFEAFVAATGYRTRAEQGLSEAEAPKISPALRAPGSIVFVQPESVRGYADISQWWKFVPGATWRKPDGPEGTSPPPDAPAVQIAYEDALAYARWRGHDLPTEAEWEWAARGVERRRFPWGDEPPDGARANYADSSTDFPWNDPNHDDGFPGLAPVGQYPAGATPLGVMDMAGNVREWTASARLGLIDPRDNRIWPLGRGDMIPAGIRPEPMPMYIVKGGSFDGAADDLRGSDVRMLPPETRHPALGFRCARDAD